MKVRDRACACEHVHIRVRTHMCTRAYVRGCITLHAHVVSEQFTAAQGTQREASDVASAGFACTRTS